MTITETQKQVAIDAINELCKQQLEYETSHRDAGDGYADLVSMLWDEHSTYNMLKLFNDEKRDHGVKDHFAADSYKTQWQLLGIDKRWKDIEPDVLADMALETFNMVPGSIWGPDCIVLESFHIGEIEVELGPLGIDAITMDLIRESCDAYISGNDYAYIATDAVWYAVVNVENLNVAIEDYITSMES